MRKNETGSNRSIGSNSRRSSSSRWYKHLRHSSWPGSWPRKRPRMRPSWV